LAGAEGNEEEAIKLASGAEHIAGTEATSVRDRAVLFKERSLGEKRINSLKDVVLLPFPKFSINGGQDARPTKITEDC
jgi:hypothetical protein